MHVECDFFHLFSSHTFTVLVQIPPGIFRLTEAFVDAYG